MYKSIVLKRESPETDDFSKKEIGCEEKSSIFQEITIEIFSRHHYKKKCPCIFLRLLMEYSNHFDFFPKKNNIFYVDKGLAGGGRTPPPLMANMSAKK